MLAKGLPDPDTTIVEVVSAVDYVLPAIEVVGSRIVGWDITIVDTVADNASSGAFVLGNRPVRLADVDLRTCKMRLTIDGETAAEGVGEACLGHPLNAVTWLARTVPAHLVENLGFLPGQPPVANMRGWAVHI